MTQGEYSTKILKSSRVPFVDGEAAKDDMSIKTPQRVIEFMYGAPTPCRLEDFRTKIGDAELSYEEVGELVGQLSQRTGKEYSYGVIGSDDCCGEEYDAILLFLYVNSYLD